MTAPRTWRPIAEAPRDGTRVLVCVDWDGLAVVAFYGTSAVVDPGKADWRVSWDHERLGGPGEREPTHWLPLDALPPPPQEEE